PLAPWAPWRFKLFRSLDTRSPRGLGAGVMAKSKSAAQAVAHAPPPPEPVSEEQPKPNKPARRATAEARPARRREISVSEFFTKHRPLLGFDNPAKALLTTVKEAVDNSLDACEEAGILPDITVEIKEVTGAATAGAAPKASQTQRFRVAIED